jgi:NAD(P)-dependent dehydrogenase (short-subunit alcohol dehydrogenase family)
MFSYYYMHNPGDLAGKTALVTGGGGDIGSATSMALAHAGADVIVVDLRQNAAEATADNVRRVGRRAHAVVGDCADDAAVRSMAEEALARFGAIDVLVNVAGRGDPRWLWELERPDFDRLIGDNLGSTWSWSHALGPLMRDRGWGRIINTGSISAKHGGGPPGTVGKSAYAATKAGILGLTRGLAKELAPHVTVNAVCPGLIETRGTKSVTEGPNVAEILRSIPKGRFGRPEDVAAAVLFFASPASDWITGECMDVNGGQYID